MTDRDAPARWGNVWAMSFTVMGALMAIMSWNRILALYLRSLGAGESQIGWSYFFLAISFRLPQFAGGWLADRFGRKRSVVLGTVGMAVAYLGVAYAPTWPLVVAANCLCWMIGALQWPAIAAMVADSVPESSRGRAMGLLEAGSMIGITAGPFAGALVLEAFLPLARAWRFLLVGTCVVYLACTVVRAFLLREISVQRKDDRAQAPAAWSALAVPLLVNTLSFMVFFLTTEGPVMALYIVDEARGTAMTVQHVSLFGGLAAIVAALAAGWLVDRAGMGRMMLLMSVLTAVLLAPFVFGWRMPRAGMWIFALLFIPAEAYFVAYQKLVTSLAPPGRRGLYIGLGGTAVGAGASWILVLAGTLYEGGHGRPLIAAAALQGVAVLAGLPLLRKKYNSLRQRAG